MTLNTDLDHCREAIRQGSRSFHAASKLLPRRVRDPAQVLYAFCRLADDTVDLHDAKQLGVDGLRERLALAYAGSPREQPVDRAFARLIQDCQLPRALPEALLEGLQWDADGRRYETLSSLRAYAARVASAVGAMMCVLMGVRSRDALARACDLGVAMQLTNIARDVGEDARARRVYLPLEWLAEKKIDPGLFLDNPAAFPEAGDLVRRLLVEANRLYFRSEAGIESLPYDCRAGIFAARHIYARIGRRIAAANYDSISARARTSLTEKMALLMLSSLQAVAASVMPKSAVLHAEPLEEVAFLVDATAQDAPVPSPWGEGKAGEIFAVLAQLERRERAQRIAIDAL